MDANIQVKKGFNFIKKKVEPPKQTNEENLNDRAETLSTTSAAKVEKKGFSFIKKTQDKPQQQVVVPAPTNTFLGNENSSQVVGGYNLSVGIDYSSQRNNEDENRSDSNFSYALNKLDSMNPNTQSQSYRDNSIQEERDSEIERPVETKSAKKGFNFIKKKQPTDNREESIKGNNDDVNNEVSETKSMRSFQNLKDNLTSDYDKDDEGKVKANKYFIPKQVNSDLSPREAKSSSTPNKHDSDNGKILNVQASAENVRSNINDLMKKNEDSLKEIIIKIHLLKTVIMSKEESLKLKKKDLENVFHKQNIALENNDFDEAQTQENNATSIKQSISDLKKILRENEKELVGLREQELSCVRQKIKVYEDSQTLLGNLKQSQNRDLESFLNNDVAKHKNDKIKIKKMNEKLEILKQNLETKKSHIDEEEEKVNVAIKSQSSEVFVEKDDFEKQRNVLMGEINEIQKILDKKFAELDVLNKNIEAKELEIDAIRSNFNHELNKLNTQKKYYEESFTDYEYQLKQYNEMCNIHDNEGRRIHDKKDNYERNISCLEEEISSLGKETNEIKQSLRLKGELLETQNEIKHRLMSLQTQIDDVGVSNEKNQEQINTLEFSISKIEAEITTINLKIPSMEAEKKNYVQSKNFKMAGTVSNELKKLGEEKSTLEVKLKENKEEIEILKSRNDDLQKIVFELNEKRKIEETQYDINRYQYIQVYKLQLAEYLSKIPVESKDYATLSQEMTFVLEEMKSLEELEYIKERFKKTEPSVSENEEKQESDKTELAVSEILSGDDPQRAESKDLRNEEEPYDITEHHEKTDEINEHLEDEHKENEEEQENVVQSEPTLTQEEIHEKIASLEITLQESINNEDFDAAEHINNELESLKKLLTI